MTKTTAQSAESNLIQKAASNKPFMICAALFCCALWGISTPIVKIGYNHIEEAHIPSLFLWAGLLFVVSGVLTIFIYSVCSKKLVLPQKESVKGVVIISAFQTVLQYALLYIGLSLTTSVKGAILKSTDVFFIAIIAALIIKTERLTAKKLISCIIGFSGIVIMNFDGLSLNIQPVGDGLVVLAIISYSFSVVMTRLFAQQENPIVLCSYQMTLGGAVLSLIGFSFGGKFDIVGMLPVFICLSLIYAVSYTTWTILLKYNPASSVTIYSFMTPVFGVIFSSLLLSEDNGVALPNLIIALLFVCAGILLWGYQKTRNASANTHNNLSSVPVDAEQPSVEVE